MLCTTPECERWLGPEFFHKNFDVFIKGLIKLQSMKAGHFQEHVCVTVVLSSSS